MLQPLTVLNCISWLCAGVFVMVQVAPLLGVFVFRKYVERELARRSDISANGARSEGDHSYERFGAKEAGRERRGNPFNAACFHLGRYLRNLLLALRTRDVSAISRSLAGVPYRTVAGRELRGRREAYTPKVSVILPCKGIDPGFEQNVRSLLEQDYPDFEIIFITATQDDPARGSLERILPEYPERKARLLVAGIRPGRSQKLNNQLFAYRMIRADSTAIVFVDSDVRAHKRYLRDLVEPLDDEGVGATTGFRWYIPEKGGLGSYLRATWNGGGLPILADQWLAYAWGGSMGILRGTFEKAGVADRWENALTDDFPLTDAVREKKLSVHFVPTCLLGSHEDTSLRETIGWTNRQTVICRVYNPRLWRVIFTSHAIQTVGFLFGVGLLLTKGHWPETRISLWPALVMFSAIPLQVAFGMLLWRTVRQLLPEIGGWKKAVVHAALVPAAILLIFYNSLHSVLTKDIRWRGVRYRLHSSHCTEVLQAD